MSEFSNSHKSVAAGGREEQKMVYREILILSIYFGHKQIQIAGFVPQPRLFSPFLSWCDFGVDCKKVRLGWNGNSTLFRWFSVDQASPPPPFHIWPVLNFLSLCFALVRNFSLRIFCMSLEDWAYVTLLCIYCELRAYVWMYLWLSLSAVICWVRKTGWWDCPTKPSGSYKCEWDSLN